MRVFDRETAKSMTDGPLEITRWEQFEATKELPFQAMWYSVAPGTASLVDQHPEIELSVVLRGEAEVEIGGVLTVVPQGSAFLLDSTEAHVIHNRSTTVPLDILSAYWMPGAGPAPDADVGTGPAADVVDADD
jgi:mannose-6-phosphate isomerase-like protein (cupin superfamily)